MRRAYGRLIAVAEATRRQAVQVRAALGARAGAAAQRLAREVGLFLPRVERALAPVRRRTLKGEAVPAAETIVSLVEPHPPIIVRHKAGKPVAFGRKLRLEEGAGSIVSGWRRLDAPGQDIPDLLPSLAAHRRRFGRPARLVAADRDGVGAPIARLQDRAPSARPERGVLSPQNEGHAARAGVTRVVSPPAAGRSRPAERAQREGQRWFRRGLRVRAGITGRIGVLPRCYGLARCRDHGERGPGRWISWGIVTANRGRIARTLAAREQAQAVSSPPVVARPLASGANGDPCPPA